MKILSKICFAFYFFSFLNSFNVFAEIPEPLAIKCLMGEARGEGLIGMQAVGEVLRRRNSTKGIYGCKAEVNEPNYVWERAKKAWRLSENSNLSNGATHFENVEAFGLPSWANKMIVITKIKNHTFFKEKK